ncbi:hypothetical protein M0812_27718 [Anaeramoeba flamelloides]|uniref:Non-specific serine/threonine protein kinase n=1 Tax=Anaeramoeba flamelloides TaxID=1746091 RepID=A0AAV7YCL1_9EUKA|nr:hypothetical protein M0812_27718 [Anaeramoeba flamelloides]
MEKKENEKEIEIEIDVEKFTSNKLKKIKYNTSSDQLLNKYIINNKHKTDINNFPINAINRKNNAKTILNDDNFDSFKFANNKHQLQNGQNNNNNNNQNNENNENLLKSQKILRSSSYNDQKSRKITRYHSFHSGTNQNLSQKWEQIGARINPSLVSTKSLGSLKRKIKKILKTQKAYCRKKSKTKLFVSLDKKNKKRIDFEIDIVKIPNLSKVRMLKFTRRLIDFQKYNSFYQLISENLDK